MQYIEKAINEKKVNIDSILNNTNLLYGVLNKELNCSFTVTPLKRIWEGGGSTQFIIETSDQKFFLKVKSSLVTVESKLEEESDAINESSLKNECTMIYEAKKIHVNCPDVVFFHRAEGFDFLCLQYIKYSFQEALDICSVDEIISLWEQLKTETKKMYTNGMIHTDIHEHNIRYQDKKIYLIDFEEARFFNQESKFECSLDYIGYNNISSLGKFPLYLSQDFTVPFNCLVRMKQVINENIAKKLFDFAKECYYDSSNGICTSLDHGTSKKTYQEITNDFFSLGGQRNDDSRIGLINAICQKLVSDNFTFIDVGSNNGLFGRTIPKINKEVVRCIGLEGFPKFNRLARGLAFIEDVDIAEYVDFLCGKDTLDDLNISGTVVLSVCSVWHHINNKTHFLDQLKKLDIRVAFFEFAVQNGLYGEHSWEQEIEYIMKYLSLKGMRILTFSSDYNRPFIMLTQEHVEESQVESIMADYNKYCMNADANISKDNFENYCNRTPGSKKYFVCFGAGEYGRKAIRFLKGEIAFFIDNNSSKSEFEGYKVLNLNEAVKYLAEDTTIVISTSHKFFKEIKDQLRNVTIGNVISLEEFLDKGYIKHNKI